MKKTKSKIFGVIVLILCLTSIGYSQGQLVTENVSIKDGLSSNLIRDILQDKYGYLWISTIDGVNIYDGYKISIFKNIANDSTSLPSNVTYRIYEDTRGDIWISTDEGLARYNRSSNNFSTFKPSESSAELANQTIHLFEDGRNNFWVNTSEGVVQFDRDTETFNRYDVMIIDNSVMRFVNYGGAIVESSNGNLYCTAQSFGLLKFDYEAQLFVEVPLNNDGNDKITMHRYYDIASDSLNNIWLAIETGLLKIDLSAREVYDVTPFNKVKAQNRFVDNAVVGLKIDSNGKMWIGTGRNGVYLYNPENQKYTQEIFASANIFYSRIIEDASGILWFASSRGIMKYDPNRKPFITYSLSNDNDETRKEIYSISKNKNNQNKVWLATAKGIYEFDDKNNNLSKASDKYSKLSQIDNIGVYRVLETKEGLLWVASANRGLFSYNTKTNGVKNYLSAYYDTTKIFHNSVHNLAFDQEENLWVATHNGLNYLKKGDSEFKPISSFLNRKYNSRLLQQLNKLKSTSNPTSSIIRVGDYADLTKEFVIREDIKTVIYSVGEGLPAWGMVDFGWLESESGDTIWTGSDFNSTFHASGGIKNRIKIDVIELKAGRYKLRYKSDDSHSFVSYNDQPPQDSAYWGTQIFSLNDDIYNSISKLVEKSNNKTYLEGEDIKVIFCDSNNEMWIGTDDGLSHINSELIVKNYSPKVKSLGVLSNNFVRDINEDLFGNIWIATADGLNKLDRKTDEFTVIRETDGLPSSNISSVLVDNDGNLWVSGVKGISKIELDENGELQIVVNYDVKDGLQGYEFIQSSSYKDESGKLYFGGIDGFNAFYPGNSNRTPPFISIQDVRISNKSIQKIDESENSNLNLLTELSLSHNQNDLSFEFASIHFSRPDKNRILYKMEGIDEEWQVGDRRFASYTNINPGEYSFYLKGSNGDGIWNEEVREININISPPWYNNWTAYTVYGFLFFGLLLSVRKFEMRRQQKNIQIKESQFKIETAEAKAEAAEARALIVQAENERKSKELEEARQLQLSMLPRDLPQLPNLDIAVYMKTATEVGGDYYDFHIGMDGTLTVVLGDATGHGMKAGTMVTTTKSLFNVLAPNPSIVDTFHEMTRCLKLMHMEKLSMCMTMLKIMEEKVQMSSAGMPPVFIYKKDSQVMEEHVIKGMPLGTFAEFPYSIVESNLGSGDAILLTSDGFPELVNSENEAFGYKRVRNLFEEIAGETPEQIIRKLKDAGSDWVNDKDPDDDVTFVVIKVK